MGEKTVTLYPGNWLYNASVIGFLLSIEKVEGLNNKYFLLKDEGSLEIDKELFLNLDVNKRYFSTNKIAAITAKVKLYKNYLQKKWEEPFPFFVKSLYFLEEKASYFCDLCGSRFNLPKEVINNLKDKGLGKFLEGIKKFDMRHNSLLGPSPSGFPNSFWGEKHTLNICVLCSFLIIHHHLAFTKLIDGSEIFINTPSFKIMWYLNKYAQEVYEKEKAKTTKEILGISLIEMSSKLYIQLGKWILMNIEVITKHNEDRLDFFSLPYEVLLVISDREIASLLNNIGEQSILNLVLDGDFKNIIEIGREILKLGLKPKGERENQKDFINKIIKINNNLENMTSFSQKLFKLYALIEEKLKGGILV